jgi:DNA polymerase I-like protein with 3'-5' exonuclease and polymerase domains
MLGGVPWIQMGADASGLELRCLAHYMARYDNGAYARTVVEGTQDEGTDPHSITRDTHGLGEFGKKGRDVAKTWIYAWLYGAGDEKLGLILSEVLCPGANEKRLKALGAESRAKFLKRLPALSYVVEAVQHAARTRGYVKLIDGRRALCRAEHSALNTLLQGTGAVLFKRAIVEFASRMTAQFGPQGWDGRWAALIWYHDEIQVALQKIIAEQAQAIAVASVEHMTEHYSFRCPLTGEAKLGHNWAECH